MRNVWNRCMSIQVHYWYNLTGLYHSRADSPFHHIFSWGLEWMEDLGSDSHFARQLEGRMLLLSGSRHYPESFGKVLKVTRGARCPPRLACVRVTQSRVLFMTQGSPIRPRPYEIGKGTQRLSPWFWPTSLFRNSCHDSQVSFVFGRTDVSKNIVATNSGTMI